MSHLYFFDSFRKKEIKKFSAGRGQRGDMLIDALVSVLLAAILSLGLAYGVAQIIRLQRTSITEGVAISYMRNVLMVKGVSNMCNGSVTPPSISYYLGSTTLRSVSLSVNCTTPSSVTISVAGGDAGLSQTLPAASLPPAALTLSTQADTTANSILGNGANSADSSTVQIRMQ